MACRRIGRCEEAEREDAHDVAHAMGCGPRQHILTQDALSKGRTRLTRLPCLQERACLRQECPALGKGLRVDGMTRRHRINHNAAPSIRYGSTVRPVPKASP